MNSEQIAENVKRLQDVATTFLNAPKHRNALRASVFPEAIQTINALVELVGEIYENLSHLPNDLLKTTQEIAALAKGDK